MANDYEGYMGIGEADKRIAELEAENASLRAELAEFRSWQMGAVPDGIDNIEYRYWDDNEIKTARRARRARHGERAEEGAFWTSPMHYIVPAKRYITWRPIRRGGE
jgi:hypothetical protein